MSRQLVSKIWNVVKNDLTDRRGIRQEWTSCDDDVKAEIDETNVKNINTIISTELSKVNFKSFTEIDLDGLKINGKCNHCNKKYVVSGTGPRPQNVTKNGKCNLNFGCPNCEEPILLGVKLMFSIDY